MTIFLTIGLLRDAALSRFPRSSSPPFFSLQLLRPPSSTITSLTGEQVRRSTHRTGTVLVSAFKKKSPLFPLSSSLFLSRWPPQRIRVRSTFCLSNKSGRKSRGWVTVEMLRRGVAIAGKKRWIGREWRIVASGTSQKGYSLAGKSKDENNMAIK